MKTRADAESLAHSLVRTGKAHGVHTQAVMTAMNAPLGSAVGNALEVRECLDTLRGEGPADLRELSVLLAARMVVLGGLADGEQATAMVRQALASGRGLDKFRQIIETQGGDPRVVDEPNRLPAAPDQVLVRAEHSGYIAAIGAEEVGHAAMLLGAGRDKVEDAIDPAVGVIVKAARGERVRVGDALAEVHYRVANRLDRALDLLKGAWQIADVRPPDEELVLGWIE